MANWLTPAVRGLASQFGGPFPEVPEYLRRAPLPTGAMTTAPQVSAPDAPATFAAATVAPPMTGMDAPRPPALTGMMRDLAEPPRAAVGQSFSGPREAFDSYRLPFQSGGPRQAATKQMGAYAGQDQGMGQFGGGGMAGDSGNPALDAHNAELNAVAGKYGLPANVLKAVLNRESSGNWERDGSRVVSVDGTLLLPFVGMKREAAESVGMDFNSLIGNKSLQIEAMARILSRDFRAYGSWESAASNYLTGDPNGWQNGAADSKGLRADYYVGQVISDWKRWDQMSGGGNLPTFRAGDTGLSNNSVVQEALQFVGTPYVWGSIPGASQDPRSVGWDCSGMTYWLDQKYGSGSLPMGSHYQYDYAVNTGRLFTDMSQLQPGDLVFIDTGWQGGAGAELNRAGHVGIYIGNGQMLHAANPSQGTIVSPLSGYGGILGAMHQSFSGGMGGGWGGAQSNNPYRVRGGF